MKLQRSVVLPAVFFSIFPIFHSNVSNAVDFENTEPNQNGIYPVKLEWAKDSKGLTKIYRCVKEKCRYRMLASTNLNFFAEVLKEDFIQLNLKVKKKYRNCMK